MSSSLEACKNALQRAEICTVTQMISHVVCTHAVCWCCTCEISVCTHCLQACVDCCALVIFSKQQLQCVIKKVLCMQYLNVQIDKQSRASLPFGDSSQRELCLCYENNRCVCNVCMHRQTQSAVMFGLQACPWLFFRTRVVFCDENTCCVFIICMHMGALLLCTGAACFDGLCFQSSCITSLLQMKCAAQLYATGSLACHSSMCTFERIVQVSQSSGNRCACSRDTQCDITTRAVLFQVFFNTKALSREDSSAAKPRNWNMLLACWCK